MAAHSLQLNPSPSAVSSRRQPSLKEQPSGAGAEEPSSVLSRAVLKGGPSLAAPSGDWLVLQLRHGPRPLTNPTPRPHPTGVPGGTLPCPISKSCLQGNPSKVTNDIVHFLTSRFTDDVDPNALLPWAMCFLEEPPNPFLSPEEKLVPRSLYVTTGHHLMSVFLPSPDCRPLQAMSSGP